MSEDTQTVYKSGSSLVVVVPSAFVDVFGVKKGDKVMVNIDYEHGSVTYKYTGSNQLLLDPTILSHQKLVATRRHTS